VFGTARVPIDLIKDISVNNVSNPYLPGAYHILLMLKAAASPTSPPAKTANGPMRP
jgi:hypothetical protein